MHCRSLKQAKDVLAALENRMAGVGLRLHPDKTKIVYCKDANRRLAYASTQFTFLGYTFRARRARGRGGAFFASFQPAVSKQALKKISEEIRSWRLHRWSNVTMREIARFVNPKVAGWMAYYAAFYGSALYPVLQRINAYLVRWMRRKYKRLKSKKKALETWWRLVTQYPGSFVHWKWTVTLADRMTGAR